MDWRRYVFIQDDDSHWYAIQESDVEEFSTLLANWDEANEAKFLDKYDSLRIDSHPSHYTVMDIRRR